MSSSPFDRPPKAMLFDVDGTLINTIEMIVCGLTDAFSHYLGRTIPEPKIRELIGMPLKDQMNLFGLHESTESTLQERVHFTMERYIAHAEKSSEFGPAIQALHVVADSGIDTALVTSRNADELDWVLNRFPSLQKAKVAISSSDTERPKPAPDPALLACSRLGCKPEEAWFIGDSVHDMETACQAGATPIGVSYGAASRSELINSGAAMVLDSPDELYHVLTQANFQKHYA